LWVQIPSAPWFIFFFSLIFISIKLMFLLGLEHLFFFFIFRLAFFLVFFGVYLKDFSFYILQQVCFFF
jgi:hypothetical protein